MHFNLIFSFPQHFSVIVENGTKFSYIQRYTGCRIGIKQNYILGPRTLKSHFLQPYC